MHSWPSGKASALSAGGSRIERTDLLLTQRAPFEEGSLNSISETSVKSDVKQTTVSQLLHVLKRLEISNQVRAQTYRGTPRSVQRSRW